MLIYQASYEQVQISDDWKRAFVTPLFKQGARARQVSLTYCCCKVIENIVHSRHMKFLESNKILNDFQHGLRKSRSCETQLITTIHNLAVGPDRLQQVGAILLDFSKNFEKAPYYSPGSQAPSTKRTNQTTAFLRRNLSSFKRPKDC